MVEHPEDRTIQQIHKTAVWGSNHEDAGVRLLANDIFVLDLLCRELFMALKEPELSPSAKFKYATLYDTFSV